MWCIVQSSPQQRNEKIKLAIGGASSPILWRISCESADFGRSGTFNSSTSNVMAMAKMPSGSASMRALENRMPCNSFLTEGAGFGGVLIWAEIVKDFQAPAQSDICCRWKHLAI